MRKITFVLLILCLALISSQLRAADAESLFRTANELYDAGEYAKAAESYEELISRGYDNAEIYHNLGNSYYKQDMVAPAIVSYERALKLNPADEDTRFNLRLANLKTVDKIDPIPQFFLNAWIENAYTLISAKTWGLAFTMLIWLAALLGVLFVAIRSVTGRKMLFPSAVLSLAAALVVLFFAFKADEYQSSTKSAVVYQPSVYVKSSPSEESTKLFLLHEGTKLTIDDRVGEWVEIRIADGNKGWVPRQAIEVI